MLIIPIQSEDFRICTKIFHITSVCSFFCTNILRYTVYFFGIFKSSFIWRRFSWITVCSIFSDILLWFSFSRPHLVSVESPFPILSICHLLSIFFTFYRFFSLSFLFHQFYCYHLHKIKCPHFLKFIYLIYLFLAARALFLVAASGGHSVVVLGLLIVVASLVGAWALGTRASVVVARGL